MTAQTDAQTDRWTERASERASNQPSQSAIDDYRPDVSQKNLLPRVKVSLSLRSITSASNTHAAVYNFFSEELLIGDAHGDESSCLFFLVSAFFSSFPSNAVFLDRATSTVVSRRVAARRAAGHRNGDINDEIEDPTDRQSHIETQHRERKVVARSLARLLEAVDKRQKERETKRRTQKTKIDQKLRRNFGKRRRRRRRVVLLTPPPPSPSPHLAHKAI